MKKNNPAGIYEKLTIPENYRYVSISKEEAEFIYSFIKEKGIKDTLETGLSFGCSTTHIISATNSAHYAIDPHEEKQGNIGLNNIKKFGLEKYLIYEKDYSYNVLPRLLKEGKKFDFAFIDGNHRFDDVFIDFFYSDLLLRKKGYVLFHDTWMRPIQLVSSWIRNDKKNYRQIKNPCKNMILFQKEQEKDNRRWFHFKEFYNLDSILLHPLNNLLDRRRQENTPFE